MSATRLLLRLTWTRWRNRLGLTPRDAPSRAERDAVRSASKSRRGWKLSGSGSGLDPSRQKIWMVFGPLIFLVSSAMLTSQVSHLRRGMEKQDRVWEQHLAAPTPEGDEAEWRERAGIAPDAEPPVVPAEDALRRLLAVFVGCWFIGVLLTEFSNAGLETAGWDLEWLATLPVSIAEIARARLLARTIVAPLGWLWLGPLGVAISFLSDAPAVLAPLAGMLAIVPLLFVSAVVVVFAEIGLHLFLRPGAVRNVKAVASLLAGVSLFGVLQSNLLSTGTARLGGWFGAVMDASPFGLVVRIFVPRAGESSWLALALLVAEAAVVYAVGSVVLGRLVRSGIVSGGARVGMRGVSLTLGAPRAPVLGLSPLLHREFKLLRRDMNYLAQAFLLPIALTLFQLGMNFRGSSSERSLSTLCAWGFGVAAYTYLQSALRTLILERESFWVLFTFPRPLSELLRVKSQLYAALGLVFAVAFLVSGRESFARFTWSDVAPLALMVVGAPLFAFVMTAIGVISTRVLDVRASKQASPLVMYATMTLIAAYTGTIAAASPWGALGVLVLTLMLTLALWQIAVDRLPYLLDPDARIPRKLTLVHGIVALLGFTLLQQLLFALAAGALDLEPASAIFVSYAVAALVVSAITLSWLGSRDVPLPAFLPPGSRARSIAIGVGVGLACAALGLGWQSLAIRLGWIDGAELEELVRGGGFFWIAALAVLAAPLCEELLFRGLVFDGLRRSFGVARAALASALLFAILHPMPAFPPVFLVGLATAWLFARTGSLLASITTHVVYNLLVLGGAWLLAR